MVAPLCVCQWARPAFVRRVATVEAALLLHSLALPARVVRERAASTGCAVPPRCVWRERARESEKGETDSATAIRQVSTRTSPNVALKHLPVPLTGLEALLTLGAVPPLPAVLRAGEGQLETLGLARALSSEDPGPSQRTPLPRHPGAG